MGVGAEWAGRVGGLAGGSGVSEFVAVPALGGSGGGVGLFDPSGTREEGD